jgi:hypothetical protein
MSRIAILMVLGVVACSSPSGLVKRPGDPGTDQAVTTMWTSEIGRVVRDGDWLLLPSHASIYDAEHGTVIEAAGDGVRELPLAQVVGRNHYVIVVRPSNMTAQDQHEAVLRARTRIGAPFDELVYWASRTEARTGARERIVAPSDLMEYGEVIYWSGKRDDDQVMALAKSRR